MWKKARPFLLGLFSARKSAPPPTPHAEGQLPYPVQITLSAAGQVLESWTATTDDDLDCRVEMMTGVRWLDCREQYVAMGRRRVSRQRYEVVNSFEKWGDYQWEKLEVEVRLERL